MGQTHTKSWNAGRHSYFFNEILTRRRLLNKHFAPIKKITDHYGKVAIKMKSYIPLEHMTFEERLYIKALNALLTTLLVMEEANLIYSDVKPNQLLWDNKNKIFLLTDMEHVYQKKFCHLHHILHSHTPKFVPKTYSKMVDDCGYKKLGCFTLVNDFPEYYRSIYLPQIAYTILALGLEDFSGNGFDTTPSALETLELSMRRKFMYKSIFEDLWNILRPAFEGKIETIQDLCNSLEQISGKINPDNRFAPKEFHIGKIECDDTIVRNLLKNNPELINYLFVVNSVLYLKNLRSNIRLSEVKYYQLAAVHISDLLNFSSRHINGYFIHLKAFEAHDIDHIRRAIIELLNCNEVIDWLLTRY